MSSKGLMLMLDGGPKGKGAGKSSAPDPDDADPNDDGADDHPDDYSDDLGDPTSGDEPPADFTVHAETALGTSDPVKIKALHDAMRSLIDNDMPPPLPGDGGGSGPSGGGGFGQ